VNRSTIKWLTKLIEDGYIVYSQTSNNIKNEIQHLVDCDIIIYKRKGNGGRFVLNGEESLKEMLKTRYPDLFLEFSSPPRAEAARRFRNTKLAKLDTPAIINLRSFGNDKWDNGIETLEVGKLTKSFGVAGLCISENDNWTTNTPVGLIENKEPFFNCDCFWGTPLCSQFIYYKGWLNQKFIDWLQKKKRAPEIIIFPDYDPVGLSNFLKLRNSLGRSVKLAIPQNIEELIQKYGNEKILKNNVQYISELTNSKNTQVINIVKIMQKYGRALEQELCLNHEIVQF
jgi:hypothetical protein